MLLKTQMSVGLLKYLKPPRAVPENKIQHFTFELRKIIHVIEDLKKMVKVVLLNFVLSKFDIHIPHGHMEALTFLAQR